MSFALLDCCKNLATNELYYVILMTEASERNHDTWLLLMEFAKRRCDESVSLTESELNKFVDGTKNGYLRSIRTSYVDAQSAEAELNETKYNNSFANKILIKFHREINVIIAIIINKLIPNAAKNKMHQNMCAYNRLCGDCYRYLCEYPLKINDNNNLNYLKNQCNKYYDEAIEIANKYLNWNNRYYISSYNNYAVFMFDILGDKQKGYELVKNVFDTVNMHMQIQNTSDKKQPAIQKLLQIIHENLILWKPQINSDQNTGS